MTNTILCLDEFQKIFGFKPENHAPFSEEENAKVDKVLGILAKAARLSELHTEVQAAERRHTTSLSQIFYLAYCIAKKTSYCQKYDNVADYARDGNAPEINQDFLEELNRIRKICEEIRATHKDTKGGDDA